VDLPGQLVHVWPTHTVRKRARRRLRIGAGLNSSREMRKTCWASGSHTAAFGLLSDVSCSLPGNFQAHTTSGVTAPRGDSGEFPIRSRAMHTRELERANRRFGARPRLHGDELFGRPAQGHAGDVNRRRPV
jgi:hypothetical protein